MEERLLREVGGRHRTLTEHDVGEPRTNGEERLKVPFEIFLEVPQPL